MLNDKKDPRHNARRIALASLFSWQFSDPTVKDSIVLSKELYEKDDSEIDTALLENIVEGVKTNIFDIDKYIETSAPEWPIDKIAKCDLVILRIAVYELVFGKIAPLKVVIDEAVELAKEFGSDASSKFVNGVLGSVSDISEAQAQKTETSDQEGKIMSQADILKKIKKVISEKTGTEIEDITENSFLQDDLNIGEIELADILTELEEIFEVELVDSREDIETVQDLVDLILERTE